MELLDPRFPALTEFKRIYAALWVIIFSRYNLFPTDLSYSFAIFMVNFINIDFYHFRSTFPFHNIDAVYNRMLTFYSRLHLIAMEIDLKKIYFKYRGNGCVHF